MRVPIVVFALLLFAPAVGSGAADHNGVTNHSRQCLLVVTDSWTAWRGTLQRFQRGDDDVWRLVGKRVPVTIGRAGLAWGRGEIEVTGLTGPTKREGDGKAPSGVFRLGRAFGYAQNPPTNMPYMKISEHTVAVDDPASRYYNQILDTSKVADKDWRTAEKPVLADIRYKWGIMVQHNIPPVPAKGSCIFLHIWKNSSTPTSGCTAMSEKDFLRMFAWLNPHQAPVLVQLTAPIYNEVRQMWALPALSE